MKKITHISPKLFLIIIYVLMPLSKISKKDTRFQGISKDCLLLRNRIYVILGRKNRAYSSNKTPEFGKDTLETITKKY